MTAAQKIAEAMPDASWLESDEPEMESSLHYDQLALLVKTLDWLWRDRQDFFIGANLTVYFSREQLKTRDFRGPDFFLVKHTIKKPRASWVVWEEGGKYPDLIIELLSDSTADIDREIKKELYSERFRTAEYFWFSPDTLEFAGFRLVGETYRPIEANENGLRWSDVLGLYLGIENSVLRYFTSDRQLVPTPEEDAEMAFHRARFEIERAEREARKAEKASHLAETEKARAEALASKLRELGIDPESL